MNHYYEPSNKFSPVGVPLVLAGGVLPAVVLAFIYVYAVWYIPFIYINFILTLGFGLLLGLALGWLVKVGKMRNPLMALGLGAGVGAVACYVQWALYLTLMLNITGVEKIGRRASYASTSFDVDTMLSLLLQPARILEGITAIGSAGSWTLMGVTPSGIFLYAIWLVEALVIIGGAALMAWNQSTEPFSETANEWTVEEVLPGSVAFIEDAEATKKALESGDFNSLGPMRPAVEDAKLKFARLKLDCARNDLACSFLSVENVEETKNEKGEISESTTNIVTHLRLSAEQCQELRRAHSGTPAAIP